MSRSSLQDGGGILGCRRDGEGGCFGSEMCGSLWKVAYWAFCLPEAQVITIRSGMVDEVHDV